MPYIIINCIVCNDQFKGLDCPSRKSKFCSHKCFSINISKPLRKKNCLTCSQEYFIPQGKKRSKFCSTKCIRYTADKKYLSTHKGKGFWQNATEQQKLDRLKEELDKFAITNDGCWSWGKKLDRMGYGRIGPKHVYLAHRISWIVHNGPIPAGLFICHKCDNPACTNPEHLFLGTPKDNTQDCIKKGRNKAAKGSNHYNVKLTEEQVLSIREKVKNNRSWGSLAKEYNVSSSAIQCIVHRKTWKHI